METKVVHQIKDPATIEDGVATLSGFISMERLVTLIEKEGVQPHGELVELSFGKDGCTFKVVAKNPKE